MRTLTLATMAAAMALAVIAPAQNGTQTSATITSGPWMMRKSTGDKTIDRLWFIMDRTMNAAEADTLRSMFRNMAPGPAHTLQKAIVNAIDQTAQANQAYVSWTTMDWTSDRRLGDIEIYNAMDKGLSWTEQGVLHTWVSSATASQLDAVGKLVRTAGWANSRWIASGMSNG